MSLLSKKGFSIVEMVVTLTIVSVIITVIVSNQSKYVDSAALTNLADEIALTVSQAQAYGIAVKELSAGSDNFSAAYGLSFSRLDQASQTNYIFFADRNGNQAYDGTQSCLTGGTEECLEKKTMPRSSYVSDICAVRTSGTDQCSDTGRVDISFTRPKLEAQLYFYHTSGNHYDPPNLKGAKITIKNPAGASRVITVYTSGQVSSQ